ncbi:hypothetical protein [Thalassotalea crassostreae]|uniref:hypothetical protein n=1 Tax=Thalassotalea crassostreae TaxID=1763536 RepID=UPI0008397E77|nr:hypothetical protein [Thalassotalea crassostreae]
MKFNILQNTLYTSNDKAIKTFSCPLEKEWSNLSTTTNQRIKYCASCSKNVMDINGFKEQQIIALVTVNPDLCAHLTINNSIEIIGDKPKETFSRCKVPDENKHLPVVITARGRSSINEFIKQGYVVEIKTSNFDDAIHTNIRWYIDTADGLIKYSGQYEREPNEQWTQEAQGYLGSPFAAYIIPKGTLPNSKVYIPDVIENIVESTHHNEYRLKTATANWDGKFIKINKPKVRHLMG